MKNEVKEFRRFLIANKAYCAYVRNLMINRSLKPTTTKINIEEGVPSSGWLNSTFTWVNTPEGYAYWSKLNRQWIDKVNQGGNTFFI